MTREEMIDRIKSVKDVLKEKKTIYEVLDELGVKYKKSNCRKCLKDLKNIALEELGAIESAAEQSEFNGPQGNEYFTTNEPKNGWLYIRKRANSWHGHIINQDTPVEVIEEFVKQFPTGYYKRIENNNNINNQE